MLLPKLFLTFSIITFCLFSNIVKAADEKNNQKEVTKKFRLIQQSTNTIPQFSDIVEELLPAVVNISTTTNLASSDNIEKLLDSLPEGSFADRLKDFLEDDSTGNKEVSALGSGFIISKDGYIVTNHHVIENADEIMIGLSDSRKFKAKIIGVDEKTDLALLKIDVKEDLKYIKFGDSSKSKIGEWVIVIGNPFGLGGSVSVGIISASGRNITSGKFDDFIQTDAAINRGNSGGPLFNIKGEVIGVATAIFSPSGGNVGIGFATPTTVAAPVISQLKSKGEVVRGWLGVLIHNVTDNMAEALGMKKATGAFVTKINKDSPAQKAGIIPTDVIIEFDGQKINKVKDLPDIVAKTPINKKVKIAVFRNGKTKILTTKIKKLKYQEKQKKKEKLKATAYLSGMSLIDLNEEIKKKYKISSDVKGILITKIKPGEQAAKKGIKPGDIILSANQIPVNSITSLKKIIEQSRKSKKENILLFIKRDNLKSSVVLPIESLVIHPIKK